MGIMGGGNSQYTYGMLVFAMAITLLLPLMIGIYCPNQSMDVDRDELFDGYYEMTGQQAMTKTSVWVLTGIYTPYESGTSYGYSDDGWLYGQEIRAYSPSQYQNTPYDYSVYKDDSGVYRYYMDTADYSESTGTGHRGSYGYDDEDDPTKLVERAEKGDLYTMVNFDLAQQSSIFFTESMRHDDEDGHFFYEYDGYRMSFQPISNYTAMDQDGNRIPIISTTTSLSLVWYRFYTQSGVTGMLVLSGSSGGTAFINGANIVSNYNTINNTASFDMVFNGGITMTILIKINPFYLQTYSVQECYDLGYWSIMVTSESADADAYTGTDYSLNPINILTTMIDLLTFHMDDYNLSSQMAMLCSIVFALPLYAGLITLCLDHAYLWILVGIMAAIQSSSFLGYLLGT